MSFMSFACCSLEIRWGIYPKEVQITRRFEMRRGCVGVKLTNRHDLGSMVGGENAQKLAGDVAQLVERRNGIAEVTGSTPVVSTKRWLDLVRPACLVGISCGFRLPSRDQYHLFMEVPRDGVFMEQRIMRIKDCRGQSVAEYAVVLALIVIVVVTVLMGIGQRTRDRLANVNAVNSAFDGGSGATSASGSGGGAGSSGRSFADDPSLGSAGSNQQNDASGSR
jgi:Flp pilus assembly pilin Flp